MRAALVLSVFIDPINLGKEMVVNGASAGNGSVIFDSELKRADRVMNDLWLRTIPKLVSEWPSASEAVKRAAVAATQGTENEVEAILGAGREKTRVLFNYLMQNGTKTFFF